ncbi:family 76 glycoside hydrolase [Lasiosphaeria hispida]|uniref:Mannan endo-1,6-alpha-mannosidase n=1 Tax=Lasiosphaeria hispida TaxID=260671 RepID=A0AAJ0HF03_9PEZI|nr:family 76 glycoside hydrolase [Lasiosphaeria hispida]
MFTLASVAPTALALLVGLGSVPHAAAAESPFKVDTRGNILASAKTLASDLMALYPGNERGEIPGILGLPPPNGDYYWWEGAAFMRTYIDYWHLTGDETYNDIVTEGMLWQTGPNADYLPVNWTASMGNDDTCMWGVSAMLAAEVAFPSPPQDKPQWLALAKAVHKGLSVRIEMEQDGDKDTCGGGLRWQIAPFNIGYDYKNSISTGCFFNLGARLARYTGDKAYAQSAEEAWNWLVGVGFIDNESYAVYDGAHTGQNCTDINRAQFSYSAAALAEGAGFMYNFTDGSPAWKTNVEKMTESTLGFFFPENVAFEPACESSALCTVDMLSFKSLLHRGLARLTQVAPFLADKVRTTLRASAQSAAAQCTGGKSGRECGFYWADGEFVEPSSTGVGEQMNVLAAVSNLLVDEAAAPASAASGGSSGGNGSGNGSGSGTGAGGGNGTATNTASAPDATKSTSAAGRKDSSLLMAAVGLGAAWVVAA